MPFGKELSHLIEEQIQRAAATTAKSTDAGGSAKQSGTDEGRIAQIEANLQRLAETFTAYLGSQKKSKRNLVEYGLTVMALQGMRLAVTSGRAVFIDRDEPLDLPYTFLQMSTSGSERQIRYVYLDSEGVVLESTTDPTNIGVGYIPLAMIDVWSGINEVTQDKIQDIRPRAGAGESDSTANSQVLTGNVSLYSPDTGNDSFSVSATNPAGLKVNVSAGRALVAGEILNAEGGVLDLANHRKVVKEYLGISDGLKTQYELYHQTVTNVSIYVDDVATTTAVDDATGSIIFNTVPPAGAVIRASYTFSGNYMLVFLVEKAQTNDGCSFGAIGWTLGSNRNSLQPPALSEKQHAIAKIDLSSSITAITDGLIDNSYEIKNLTQEDLQRGGQLSGSSLAPGSITGEHITVEAITGQNIAIEAISGLHISPEAIEGQHIAVEAITGVNIAPESITGEKIVAYSITGDTIAANAITSDKIAANTVTAGHIVTNAVTSDKIAANSITSGKIAANSISAGHVIAGQITGDKLAVNSVTSDKVAANTITGTHIIAGQITGDKIAVNAVTSDKIAANTITSGKIAANSITSNEIASNSITAEHISAGQVTGDKISASTITGDKLVGGTITGDKIIAGGIETANIKTGAVNADKIAAGSINTAHIVAGAVTADKIAVKAITAEKLGAGAITAEHIDATVMNLTANGKTLFAGATTLDASGVTVSEESGAYTKFDSSGINWYSSGGVKYGGIRRTVYGTVDANKYIRLNWDTTPFILLSPTYFRSASNGYPDKNTHVHCYAENLTAEGFRVRLKTVVSDGIQTNAIGQSIIASDQYTFTTATTTTNINITVKNDASWYYNLYEISCTEMSGQLRKFTYPAFEILGLGEERTVSLLSNGELMNYRVTVKVTQLTWYETSAYSITGKDYDRWNGGNPKYYKGQRYYLSEPYSRSNYSYYLNAWIPAYKSYNSQYYGEYTECYLVSHIAPTNVSSATIVSYQLDNQTVISTAGKVSFIAMEMDSINSYLVED
ncbi:MAG: hypothetical protein K0Q75_129 [Anaerospora sp.]|jgi:hypothetical protein|nr:hypothetical protein [Anaerospora sp.]